MPEYIDLRSDTVTHPTEEMYDVMRSAPLGDDNLRDDPTVHNLETLAAELTGHEAALFCPTGTMANLLGTRMFTKPGDGVVMPPELNMYRYGVIAWNSLQPIFAPARTGYPAIDDLVSAIERGLAGDTPPTLVVIEMPHNGAGGTVASPEYIAQVRAVAQHYGLAFYLDGARVYNAVVATGQPLQAFASQADGMMFCVSKGLSAPVGSILCGSRPLIERATRTRFLMGGAMRQAGLLAACGIYALNHLVERLQEDHDNARQLAQAVACWPQLLLDQPSVDTNMVYLDVAKTGMTAEEFCHRLADHGILGGWINEQQVRLVTHRGITSADIEKTIKAVDAILLQTQVSC
ncbi:MAG: low specificity L-threonine aldolase [Chloroflexi bacterium]|nr:low specificity L-threonine aldolase [Chloroflexota bacterium]